jgi:nitroimidazol reductase NimA-like FMN-containing flavoprotein (pyridoxamine 5'-phosphate oxidase superfamily)
MTRTVRGGLEVLDRNECLELLATARIGRVALHWDALPAVTPVNFALDGESIVFRTGPGTKLAAAVTGAVVAFEVDEIDPWYHEGWSVVVTGMAEAVTDPAEVSRLRKLPLNPWAPGPKDDYVRIEAVMVSGRRLSRHARS